MGVGVKLSNARMPGDLFQGVRLGDWDHTHGSAREASLSWEAPQTSRSILPWSPWGTRVTLR